MKQGLDIVALATEITRQHAAKKDIVASTEVMHVEAGENGVRLNVNDEYEFGINDVCHRQIAQHAGIPAAYYERMRDNAPELLANNVNEWFRKYPTPRMLRTMDGNGRAFMSDSYRPLENFDLAEAVLPVIQDLGLVVVSADITETKFYLKVVDGKISKDVPSGRRIGDGSHVFFDTCSPAALISNSEVGMGALNVELGMLTAMCTNLAWMMKAVRKTHLGAKHDIAEGLTHLLSDQTRKLTDAALWGQVRDVLRSSFDETQFVALLDNVKGMAEQKIEGDPVKVVELSAKKFGLNDTERGSVLKHLVNGGDLSRYGLFNAITRTAEDLPSYDRASAFEQLGGKVIQLQQAEWKVLAEAA